MNPDDEQDELWTRLRQGVLLTAKAGVAIAALAGVAQWVTRTTLDRATLGHLASRAGLEPKTTGSVAPRGRAAPPASRPVDQAGLAALASQVSGGVDRSR